MVLFEPCGGYPREMQRCTTHKERGSVWHTDTETEAETRWIILTQRLNKFWIVRRRLTCKVGQVGPLEKRSCWSCGLSLTVRCSFYFNVLLKIDVFTVKSYTHQHFQFVLHLHESPSTCHLLEAAVESLHISIHTEWKPGGGWESRTVSQRPQQASCCDS